MLNYGLTLAYFLFVKLSFGQVDDNQLSGCANNEFECDGGSCIPNRYACDGYNDCFNWSDETVIACANERCPKGISFQCAYGGCIEAEYKCDKKYDCIDGSDEDQELCGYPKTSSCPPGSFRCRNKECIDNKKLCDGEFDCLDATDEDENTCSKKTSNGCEVPTKLTNAKCHIYHCRHNYYVKDCSDDMETESESYGACIKLSCDKGYALSDYKAEYYSTCRHGNWTPQLPSCIECGMDHRIGTHIDGGNELSRPVPWHVALYEKQNNSYHYFCGGTIAHAQAVITAAHCVMEINEYTNIVFRFRADQIVIAAGKMYTNYSVDEQNAQKITVRQIRVNGYSSIHGNDIAILILAEKIKMNYVIMPICLEFDKQSIDWRSPDPSVRGTVVGFGNTKSGKLSHILKEASFDICCNETICKQKIPGSISYIRGYVTEDKFCVIEEKDGASVLKGDSGGGFVVAHNNRHYLYGIVSDRADAVVMYTFVKYHIEWIFKKLDVNETPDRFRF